MKLKYRVIERFRNKYSVTAMCSLLEVSRSGYYDWRKRQGKEAKDQWLINLIVDCQKRCKQTYGCR
ncbi:MAG: IS3 family transposase, partial [Pygmaiobacter sp.]